MVFLIQIPAFFLIDNSNGWAWFWFLSNVAAFAYVYFNMDNFDYFVFDSVFLFQAWNLSIWLSLFYLLYRLIFF